MHRRCIEILTAYFYKFYFVIFSAVYRKIDCFFNSFTLERNKNEVIDKYCRIFHYLWSRVFCLVFKGGFEI